MLKAVEVEVVVEVVLQLVWTGGAHCRPQKMEQGCDTLESGS